MLKKRNLFSTFFSLFFFRFTIGASHFLFLLFIVLFPVFSACSDQSKEKDPAAPLRVRIIQTTDIHGQYSSFSKPGIMELAFLVEKAKAEAGEKNTLYIDCGDLLQGTFESAADQGRMMIHALNLLKCDVFVPGNHELDFTFPVLMENLSLFRGKILSCNWRFSSPRAPKLFSYSIFVRNGIKIAVIGMSPRYMESWFSPHELQGLIRKNAMKEFASFMPHLMKENPSLIILAMHEGEYRSTLKEGKKEKGFLSHLFRRWPQIDLVLGGHTHLVSPGKKCYRNQWYIQAPALAGGIALADVYFDRKNKKLLSISSEIRESRKGETAPAMKKLFASKLQETEKLGRARLGYLPFAPSPAGRSLYKAMRNPFARLVSNALREKADVPIAFHGTMGSYKCRAGIITGRRLFLLTPYENSTASIPLTPEECRKVIEEQCRKVRFGHFQVPTGVRYSYSKGRVGKNLYDEKGNLWRTGEKEAIFTSYALSGAGGRFPFLAALAEKKLHARKNYPFRVREAAEEYIRKHYAVKTRFTGKKGY